MNKLFTGVRPYLWGFLPALAILVLYFLRVDADSISGLFGMFACDEATYTLSAKQQVMFGQAHLFAGDHWRPELIVPLLHAYALLTITYTDPVWLMRFGIAVQVTAGILLIAWVCGKHFGSARHAIACLFCLLLNPILFFYARLALAEGQQFLLLAMIIYLFFQLHRCQQFKEAAVSCALAGALTALLFIAKISGITGCIGCGIGLLATLHQNPALTRKPTLIGCYVAAALAMLAFYFAVIVGNQLSEWWYINVQQHALHQLPYSLDLLWKMFEYKLPQLSFYLALIPICALYLLSLPLAADKKGFVFTLFLMTLSIIAIESFAWGSIRRSFFGLNMLCILSGFVCLEYLQTGMSFPFRALKLASAAVILLYIIGMTRLLLWAIIHRDTLYILSCLLFLLLIVLGFAYALNAKHAKVRLTLITLTIIASLLPMLFQAFFSPMTREEINAAIERAVPEDAVIIGSTAPWYSQGLHRKMIFNNCIDGYSDLDYANDFDETSVPNKLYFLDRVPRENSHCAPPDFNRYRQINAFHLFMPENYGVLTGTSDQWGYTKFLYLYKKE